MSMLAEKTKTPQKSKMQKTTTYWKPKEF